MNIFILVIYQIDNICYDLQQKSNLISLYFKKEIKLTVNLLSSDKQIPIPLSWWEIMTLKWSRKNVMGHTLLNVHQDFMCVCMSRIMACVR